MDAVISDRFLRSVDVAKILGVHKKTVERMEKRGELPPKSKISHKTVGWRASRIQEFLNTL
ncbi:TPA: AlpA family phage regulatory protein [Pseudomonas aeruginosa]|jgi:predicted DNA-binding transcriptional regulator AlpA|uniref:helix-turn-helix transcriptional regulator n=1 Tax=Pseudomonas aeruginosa TaxID=287 RepID=UPI0015C39FB5|nr:AlpA family phage regulatory protein [Pseudomonas aeruginosa]MCS7728105.1 AlpA family phage regulatory protein [Pseudomonas aeruginosa]MCV6104807.1 AlpA family phage regulatory protein [Pseudomonas aeruginosa]MDI2201801.1 AlpA family phage regulatory protein [Pseudomonas aeruginosa]MDI3812030.1 AlpA family phage regulatory protein [Pseudomonas aeruginosa]MDI4056886.1 AlpA family phage regulatory protein [Pseudomonas aeruginosa]